MKSYVISDNKNMRNNCVWHKIIEGKYGVKIPAPTIVLSKEHPCYGCVWYPRNIDVLFCPFHSCVRNKKGFMPIKKVNNNDN